MVVEELQRKYPNKYIAIINDDRVVEVGDTYNEVLNKLMKSGISLAAITIRFMRVK
jgi:uncharacterized UPF0146 family protein